jgi:sulfate adenylyltransferase/3'-phosphoadenosine 5'-phosphosulfate synthase
VNGFVIWLTGLSGAGKSTIAERLNQELTALGRPPEVLDGDEVRTHLSKGLGFSKEDRDTNVSRIGYVARLVARSGGVAITAAISPYREVRDAVRAETPNFVEVFVKCSLDELVRRDVKGLYAKAIAGEIKNFTGVSDPYEEPLNPEVVVNSATETVEESVTKILAALEALGHIKLPLREALPSGPELEALRSEAEELPRLGVGSRELSDLFLLASGALSPLHGFMGSADYRSVIERGRLHGGQPFTIPVLLRTDEAGSKLAGPGERISLWSGGEPIGIVTVTEIYPTDPAAEAPAIFGTDDDAHPGVQVLKASGAWAIAGDVVALASPKLTSPEYDITPAQVRAEMERRGWKTMVGFQTRNPVHRAHEYLTKVALESIDGLLLHPLVGDTKSDDIPADVRMECYRTLLDGYYPADRAMLVTNPAWMRYAGPKEAVFHAIIRRNYGCTHFIVGRDHAGVGNYYDTYAAHRIFDDYTPEEIGIEILKFEHTFFCKACGSMASTRTCPHPASDRLMLSGTKVREMLISGEPLPVEFTRPEVAAVLSREAAAKS